MTPPEHTIIGAITTRLYQAVPRQLHKYYSEQNEVYRLEFDETAAGLPDKVIKLGTKRPASVLREQTVLQALQAEGINDLITPVEFTQNDLPDAAAVFFPFTLMPKIADDNLLGGCKNGAPWAAAACERAGRFAARLSGVSPAVLPAAPTAKTNEYDDTRKQVVEQNLLSPTVERVLEKARTLLARPATALVHGDFNAAQIVTNGAEAFTVIDWEGAEPGFTLRDVGGFRASLRVWGGDHPEHRDALLAGFASALPGSDADRDEMVAWGQFEMLRWATFYQRLGRAEGAEKILRLVHDEDR